MVVGGREILWPRADVIVWLDLSPWLTVPRVVRRSTRRAVTRTPLWSAEVGEPLGNLLRPVEVGRSTPRVDR
jgi:hypothetical protein